MSNKYHFVVKQGENNFNLPTNLSLTESSKIKISNLFVTWRFQNGTRDEQVVKTKDDGTQTNILFQPGYWSFSKIQERLAGEDVTLTRLTYSNSCRIFCQDKSLSLGLIGELLGFGPSKKVAKNTFVDSSTVNINFGVRSVDIGCSLVNSTRNWNRYQKGSEVIATIPVSTEVSLNGSIENFSTKEWCAPTRKREFSFLTFNVEDNTQHNLIKLYSEFDVLFS